MRKQVQEKTMKHKKYVSRQRKAIQKGMKIVRMAVAGTFMTLICIVFAVIGVLYSLADCAVRKLEKGGYL